MQPKNSIIDDVITAFRASGNQDDAFDNLAAARLGVNRTDMHCLNTIENAGGLTAGQLATAVGLTTGAVTGVIDRLERAGLARRVPDAEDRRRVKLEVTPAFYERAAEIWGPVHADWHETIASEFTSAELERIARFLQLATELGRRHTERLGNPGAGARQD
jgi:DNA-binding MarR family transcriptional regulator